MYLSIYPSMYLSIYLSIYLLIQLSTFRLSIYQSIYQCSKYNISIHLSIFLDECILPDTPPQSNSPSPEPEAAPAKIRERKPSARNLTILDSEMQYKVLGDVLYLKKTAVFKLFHMKVIVKNKGLLFRNQV